MAGRICPWCGAELVEVDNPMRTEFRHRRGQEQFCPGPPEDDSRVPGYMIPMPGTSVEEAAERLAAFGLMIRGDISRDLDDPALCRTANPRMPWMLCALEPHEGDRHRHEYGPLDQLVPGIRSGVANYHATHVFAWTAP